MAKPPNTEGPSKPVKKDKYPTPKKGQRLKCAGCKNGLIVVRPANPKTGEPEIKDTCKGCNGKGYIVAE